MTNWPSISNYLYWRRRFISWLCGLAGRMCCAKWLIRFTARQTRNYCIVIHNSAGTHLSRNCIKKMLLTIESAFLRRLVWCWKWQTMSRNQYIINGYGLVSKTSNYKSNKKYIQSLTNFNFWKHLNFITNTYLKVNCKVNLIFFCI